MNNYSDAIISNSDSTTMVDWSKAYILARLTPENMQELEAMIRRVVREEVSVFFEEEEEPEEEAAPSPFIGQD